MTFTSLKTPGFWNRHTWLCQYLGLSGCGVPNHWTCWAGRVAFFQFQVSQCRGQRAAACSFNGKRWYGKLFGSVAR